MIVCTTSTESDWISTRVQLQCWIKHFLLPHAWTEPAALGSSLMSPSHSLHLAHSHWFLESLTKRNKWNNYAPLFSWCYRLHVWPLGRQPDPSLNLFSFWKMHIDERNACCDLHAWANWPGLSEPKSILLVNSKKKSVSEEIGDLQGFNVFPVLVDFPLHIF